MNETDSQGLWFRSVPGATGNLCKPTECRLSTVFALGGMKELDHQTSVGGRIGCPLTID